MESKQWLALRGDKRQIEEGNEFAPKFDQDGLIPVITQDYQTHEILMMAYMNREALLKTIELGEAVYWSRSRQELWHKGATSGMVQKVREMRVDCDQDTILLRVEMVGGACCHVGYRSCFYRSVPLAGEALASTPGETLKLTCLESEKVFDPEKVYGK
ncbi:MAG TPA: phosphoribosyl-AMP cyclohydrolase [bacterium]|nr:phosphoribosyl-AMP cyclohydrolase [Candidatus Omnitrophota bacterium]HOJ59769.1 phosphoribosyl-AMP cyclohydrolase [bacterium]HPP01379.1 phosphoribosyl-AMP cyclohydrolase [bacterium]